MEMKDFAVRLIDGLLANGKLGLTEQDIRFCEKGSTVKDETLDGHIRWRNARYYNTDSNVVRNSILNIRLSNEGEWEEYVSFLMGTLYRIYQKDGGIQAVLASVENTLKEARAGTARTVGVLGQLDDLEATRKHLILRPLNYDDNEQLLANGIYRRIGDMALVLYISLGTAGGQITTAIIHRDLFRSWGLDGAEDEEALLNAALENTLRLRPPVFYRYNGNHIRVMDEECLSLDFNSPVSQTLTTDPSTNGAIAAFYPDVQERLYQIIGEDYYLVFTSIHDVHIHPVHGWVEVKTMRKRLADINWEINTRENILSRQIYRYDGEKRELLLVP